MTNRVASAIQKAPAAASQTFADYFTQVAAQNHITIAAENTPLRLTITTEEKQTLLASLQNQPLQKSLREQAAFFDYDCVAQSPRVFVLRKKYTDSSDLPYVSMDEAARLLEVSDRFIGRFKSPFKNGSFSSDPAFMETARSFTGEQLALLKQRKLPMTSLTPTQRQQMWNAFLALYLDDGALLSVQSSQFRLNTVRTEKEGGFHRFHSPAESKWPDAYAPFVFWYPSTRLLPYFKMDKLVLSYQKGTRSIAGGNELLNPTLDTQGNELPFEEASEPSETDRAAVKEQNAAHASPTVYSFKALSERLTQEAKGKFLYLVDDALASDPVSIFGMENGDAEAVFSACASAYDLRVSKEEQNGVPVFRLTTPFAAKPNTLRDLPGAIRRILPGPYVRALHLPEMNEAFAQADRAKNRARQEKADREARRARGEVVAEPVITEAERKQYREEKAKLDTSWSRWAGSPDEMERAALRRLRATVEPKAEAAPNKQLPLSGLDETEKTALTTALMRIALDGLQNLCLSHPPAYIERFDELVLQGEPITNDDNNRYLSFGFGFVKPNGSYDQVAGFGVFLEYSIPIPKPRN